MEHAWVPSASKRNTARILLAAMMGVVLPIPIIPTALAQVSTGPRKTGCLVIVGGAEDRVSDRVVLRKMIELSGGALARILVCTAASSEPEGSWRAYENVFADLGAQNVKHLPITSPEEANTDEVFNEILSADGVYLTGGDQRRLMSVLWETRAARALHLLFHLQGGIVGGTSAGAAVMSRAMLAMGEATRRPEKDTVVMDIGLGLLSSAIVDQHFNERGRLGRLLSALSYRPDLLGVGIDEDTALVVARGQSVEVIGSGNATIVDGRRMRTNMEELSASERLEMLDVRVHLLPSGHRYSLRPDLSGSDQTSISASQKWPIALREAVALLIEPGPIRG